MPRPGAETETRQFFADKYERSRSSTVRELERTVLGHEFGLNGYTTLAQADDLVQHMRLGAASRLLDIGAGFGWPGCHIAHASGCDVVLTDIPGDALREARASALERGLGRHAQVVAAEAGLLPFAAASFDGVVHSDVLC